MLVALNVACCETAKRPELGEETDIARASRMGDGSSCSIA